MNTLLYTRSEPILLPYFPRLLYQALKEQNFSDAMIFDGLSLGPEHLNDDKYRLSIEQHERFILRMLELTEDPHIALQFIHRQNMSTSNIPMMAAASSDQVAKALYKIARYTKILTRVFSVHLRQDAHSPRIELTVHVEHDQVAYFAVSAFVLLLQNFCREMLGGADLVESLHLTVPKPQGFEEVRDQFPFAVSFEEDKCCAYLDAQYLDRPLRQTDPQTAKLLTEMAEQQLQEAEAETSLVGAVKAILVDQLASPPQLDEVAVMLHLSPRSLRRKLAEADTTYQSILDGVRFATARQLITGTNEPIASIGYQLGFVHPSDFGRAFKKWSGVSPTQFRAKS